MYNDEQEHKREQAKTFAMVMKQDITNSTGTTMPDQRAATSEEHSTTMSPVTTVCEHMESQPVTKDTNNSTVQVICPTCHTAKDIHIDTLWKRNNKHRCCTIFCTSCKTSKRIGDCIRRHNSQFITVKAWLQTNSFNGISFLKHVARPPTASVESFRGVTESTTNLK